MYTPSEVVNKPVNPLTLKEARDILSKVIRSPYDPEIVLAQAKEDLEAFLSEKGSNQATINLERRSSDLVGIVGLDNHAAVTGSVPEKYRTLTLEYANRLESEITNPTVTEKTLIQSAAVAYGRYLSYTNKLDVCLNLDSTTLIMVSHCAMLGKEIERSHRQLMASLSALRGLRTPPLAVTVGSI